MNLKVLKWLLAHQAQLLQIVEIAKGWSKDLTPTKQWEVVNKIAAILIPIIEAEMAKPKALAYDDISDFDFSEGKMSRLDTPREAQFVAAGCEVQALGIDWKLITEVVIPLVVAILRAFISKDVDDE